MPIPFGHRHIGKPDGSTPEGWFAFTCGHCGRDVSGAVLANTNDHLGRPVRWLQCTSCHEASVQSSGGTIYPAGKFGPNIEGLPPDVAAAYDEARRCLGVDAFTAAEGMCRKILMHVAVDKEAKEGDTFAAYIDYLATAGYVTPPMKGWVKLIKDHGNKANHKLEASDRARAEGTLTFTAQLLRNVYEMEHLAEKFTKPAPGAKNETK
jgi:hypothetical protein